MNALIEFRKLSKIAVSHSGPVTSQAYEMLADREAMPHIEAAILGGNRDQQSDGLFYLFLLKKIGCSINGKKKIQIF